jgi:hypothetical protein
MSLTETPEHWSPDSQKCFFIGRVLKEVPEP